MQKESMLTKEIFSKRLQKIDMTQIEFANRIGYSAVAIKKWKDGKIPGWVDYVLKYFELAADANKGVSI